MRMLHLTGIFHATPPPMKEAQVNIKEACLDAAHAIIAEHGLDQLSLREVSRRLNISHQAPYKHFPSKDHLLAAVLARCFRRFAYALEHREAHDNPHESLRAMGVAYLQFAMQHPLEYKLMFGTPWPESAQSADMIAHSQTAFHVLKNALITIYQAQPAVANVPQPDVQTRADLDAIYIWSVMHGYAMIVQSHAMCHLQMPESTLQQAAQHIFENIRKSVL